MTSVVSDRLEYLRGELRAGRISYGEVAELQGLPGFIWRGECGVAGGCWCARME